MTKNDLLKGRDLTYPKNYTPEISENLDDVLAVMVQVEKLWIEGGGAPFFVNSGWRPPSLNAATPGAAPLSKHMEGLAVDIGDKEGNLARWVLSHLDDMKRLGLFFENFCWTRTMAGLSDIGGWVHFQIVPPKSGHRIFIPNANRANNPAFWNGQYDKQYDVAA
jgi:hypothetical protein